MFTLTGSNLVDLNTKLQKYTGANGTANATGVFCLSGGVYFDLNTRFEKYIPVTVTFTANPPYGSPTYNTYTSNGYHVIVITAATAASIKFSLEKSVNYIIVGGGATGGNGTTGQTGTILTVAGGSGGRSGLVRTGSFSLIALVYICHQ
jgi:hypothetical protein